MPSNPAQSPPLLPVARDEDTERDAKRWRALMASGRLRVTGYGSLGTPHQHLGLELWEIFPHAAPADSDYARKILSHYADALASRSVPPLGSDQ